MSAIVQDLRYSLRTLLRSPGFSIMVVGILALGIGANSAIFSVVNAVLLRPLPFRDPGRLHQFNEITPKGEDQGVSPMDMETFRARTGIFEQAAFTHWQNATLTGAEGPENVYGSPVSASWFDMLGVQPAIGRLPRPDEFRPGAPGVVILSDGLWQRRYNRDRGVIGRQLLLNGAGHTIIAVMPSEFSYQYRGFQLWTPLQLTADLTGDRDHRFSCLVRLKPGAMLQRAQAEVEAAFRAFAADDAGKGWRPRLVQLDERITGKVRPALLVLLGAVGFVLMIACLNVANLLLARGADRGREMALRAALGAGRFRVMRQLLTESLLLAGCGGLAGLAVSSWASRALVALFLERMPVPRLDQTRMDATVLLFTLGLCLVTGVAFGLAPALQASRANLHDSLKEAGRGASGSRRSQRLRNLLVIAETALSLVLLAGAGLMLRSFNQTLHTDPGFNPDRLLTMRVPVPASITERPRQAQYVTGILDRVRTIPGLNAVGMVTVLPLGNVESNSGFGIEGREFPPGERPTVNFRSVSAGYFRAMGMTLLQGRVFDEADGADAPPVAVISQTLARRYFPRENPIGRRVNMNGSPGARSNITIVGVVNDLKYTSLTNDGFPELYRDYRQFLTPAFATTLVLRTHAEDPMQVAATVQKEIRSVNPDQPISELRSMRQVIGESVAQPRFYTLLLGTFAALALALAAAGLYAVLSYSVTRRMHEIGIRMALGASRGAIVKDVVGHALLLVAIGVAAGLAGSLALTRLIATQLYRVTPTDPLTFGAVSAMLFGVALLASWLPARRALAVDPTVALRYE